MKILKKYILLLAVPAMLASCDLDQPVESEFSKSQIVTNEEGLQKLLIGCYNLLHNVMEHEFALTEVRSDNTRVWSTGSNTPVVNIMREIDNGYPVSSNEWITEYWDECYKLIDRCTDVLANLEVVNNPTSYARIQGQAMFLRAHLYFNLVRIYGGVPLILSDLSAQEAKSVERASKDEIYDFLESELKFILDNNLLPVTWDASELGRVNDSAAAATLAKLYMTRYEMGTQGYLQAKPLLERVLSNAGNPRNASQLVDFDKIFDINNEMNAEIIFAVRYQSGGKGIGSPFANYFAPSNSNDGAVQTGTTSSMNYPTTNIIDAFNASGGEDIVDLRKDVSLKEYFYKANGDIVTEPTQRPRYVCKFVTKSESAMDADNDWPIIRLGDVILLYAELLNESGDSPTALSYLNMIRDRAGIPAITSGDYSGKYELRELIKNERRLELAFENHRYFDLVRWGDAVHVINAFYGSELEETGSSFYTQYGSFFNEQKIVLPIPLNVINANGNIAQNPGY